MEKLNAKIPRACEECGYGPDQHHKYVPYEEPARDWLESVSDEEYDKLMEETN